MGEGGFEMERGENQAYTCPEPNMGRGWEGGCNVRIHLVPRDCSTFLKCLTLHFMDRHVIAL